MKLKNNNRGFSLVELIISISIMVILVALIAPSFVKYVQKARDTALLAAAEDVYLFAKGEYSCGNLMGQGKIRVEANADGVVSISFLSDKTSTLKYIRDDYVPKTGNGEDLFAELSGVNSAKKARSKMVYTITIVRVGEYDTSISYKDQF